MNRLRAARADSGFSLIEVVVAVMVFSVIATGVVSGMTMIVRLTADSRARTVAANLAAQDIALARAVGDPFALNATGPSSQVIGGRAYTLTRTVSWVSQSGADVACNTSGDLLYRRVNVRVSWAGRLSATPVVQNDTIVAAQGRISDSSTGAVSVSVVAADGSAVAGVAVNIIPTRGGAALPVQPEPTNALGCTTVTDVSPGSYKVTLSKSGFVDTNQAASPERAVLVTAGVTQSVSVQYDRSATYETRYPNSYVDPRVMLPPDLETTFLHSTSGLHITNSPVASVRLHPFLAGYSAVAGVPGTSAGTTTCASVDPSAWTAGTSGGVAMANGVRGSAAAPAGGTARLRTAATDGIPMGGVILTVPTGRIVTATSATPVGPGNPGCTTIRTYVFPPIPDVNGSAIALPFGSWTLKAGTTSTNGTPIPNSQIYSVYTNAAGGGVYGNGVVTLDPRARI